MGGKTKQAPRTKNNARPSNSGRSAELLGSTIPSFVGFTAHSDLGMVPLAPGFSTIETLPETFDSNVSPEFQVILRKLSKKDPVTKVKALQELNSLILESDLEIIKNILPLWPKFYHNLSNDIEYRVRESTQTLQSNITSKLGKHIAPYIKQLAPIWIASRFDKYGPAGSLALASFKTSFPPHKVQEVFIYCQNEILDFLIKNLTFHTASTLSNIKSVTPEDAENKYQRVIISSMKTFTLFLEITSSKSSLDVDEKCQNLLQNQKLWSFAKHKVSNIRSAFFELICASMQYTPRLIEINKNQIMQICFQNLDDSDPFTSPHIWGCVLLIQTIFSDWHKQINFKKVIQPKFFNIFKIISKGNASTIARNFLPFLSNLSENDIKDLAVYEFYTEFFENMKTIIQSLSQSNINTSKADVVSLVTAYFECLRYVFKKISNDLKHNESLNQVSEDYLQKYVIDILRWSFEIENVVTKNIYKHCSALIAYWSNNNKIEFYLQLLNLFWSNLFNMITISISADNLEEVYIKNIIELIKNLYTATPALHDNKVKFDNTNKGKGKIDKEAKLKSSNYLLKDLREIVIKIVKIYMDNTSNKRILNKYASQLKTLCQMFGDIDFYTKVSSDGCLLTTLSKFVELINESESPSEELVDILFDIIFLLDTNKKIEHLKTIIKSKNSKVQQWILQRILSYPLCIEPEIRLVLAEKHVIEIILQIAKNAVNENSTEKFNLLHKCFFQLDSGQILINQEVVEGIINVILEPLTNTENEDMLDTCSSFVAQVMPVICTDDNSTKNFQYKVFNELFKISINLTPSDNLSEDSLWEITTSWQDSLSCKDILLTDSNLVECQNIVENKLRNNDEISIEKLDNISSLISKLILCTTEDLNETNSKKDIFHADVLSRTDLIEKKQNILLNFSDIEKKLLSECDNICKFYETIQNIITADNISNEYIKNISINVVTSFYRKIYFIFSVIHKLVCKENTEKENIIEIENDTKDKGENICVNNDSENQIILVNWSAQLCELISNCIAVSAVGESLLKYSSLFNDEIETIVLNLSEKLTLLLKNCSERNIQLLKENITKKALNGDILWLRALPYLLVANCYQQYNESGPIVLLEEISDPLLAHGKFEIYNNLAEILLPYLTPRSLLLNEDIFKNTENIKFCSSLLRNLLRNHMSSNNCSEMDDKNLITTCIKFITQTGEKQTINKDKFLYNEDISAKEFKDVIAIVEFIKLLTEALERFPTELNIKNWDSIRIGLCSWVLTISKSIEKFSDAKVSLFMASVYKLFESLSKFIKTEKSKSSTQFHLIVIDEWENIFSKEVNLVLFKNYHSLITGLEERKSDCLTLLLEKIASCVTQIDYTIIYNACQSGFKMNINDLIEFALTNLANNKTVRNTSVHILKSISAHLLKNDLEKFEKNNETVNAIEKSGQDWHFLKKFEPFLHKYGDPLEEYINEFSYKLTELQDLKQIDKELALTYFYLWDCITYIFSKSPAELKSLYATWITINKFEHILLNFIFRAMPLEILKNHDQKSLNNDVFKKNLWELQFQDGNLSVEKCACYMYTQMLRHLPDVVRKWWNGTHARQKNFIDKLTTNFVSNLIWLEDVHAINRIDKQENMQITVHQSTREVKAAYAIDEARMELTIILPQNHPLGIIKVEMGKQIGSRISSRNIGMQLTIFITHQNGSIFDGLLLWKKNLDKKFAGVEECYVCYTVIHQDTCQLPKLTCKTCKKKFHGPCLYKWFTTSSKSTCPLCRNVF